MKLRIPRRQLFSDVLRSDTQAKKARQNETKKVMNEVLGTPAMISSAQAYREHLQKGGKKMMTAKQVRHAQKSTLTPRYRAETAIPPLLGPGARGSLAPVSRPLTRSRPPLASLAHR